MIFRCKTCKKDQEQLHMFGKYGNNQDAIDDDGEYCFTCFELKSVKYGLTTKPQDNQEINQNLHDQT